MIERQQLIELVNGRFHKEFKWVILYRFYIKKTNSTPMMS